MGQPPHQHVVRHVTTSFNMNDKREMTRADSRGGNRARKEMAGLLERVRKGCIDSNGARIKLADASYV